MEVFHGMINSINNVTSYILVALLIGVGLYLTFRSNFVQIRLFPEMFKALTEKKTKKRRSVSVSSILYKRSVKNRCS